MGEKGCPQREPMTGMVAGYHKTTRTTTTTTTTTTSKEEDTKQNKNNNKNKTQKMENKSDYLKNNSVLTGSQ